MLSFTEEYLPENDDVEDDKGEDGKKYVEKCVEPENVNIEIPVVSPKRESEVVSIKHLVT